MVNSHIKNGIVQVGQVVLLSPADAQECTIEEAEFLKVAKAVKALFINGASKAVISLPFPIFTKTMQR